MQRVPDVQTEETVRAFSGTLRRISGGAGVSCFDDPLTAVSVAAAAAILVEDRDVHGVWLEILLLAPHEKPRTPL